MMITAYECINVNLITYTIRPKYRGVKHGILEINLGEFREMPVTQSYVVFFLFNFSLDEFAEVTREFSFDQSCIGLPPSGADPAQRCRPGIPCDGLAYRVVRFLRYAIPAAMALAQARRRLSQGYADGREARLGIAAWFAFYNTRRPHQALGYAD
jgi:hypothetical protein